MDDQTRRANGAATLPRAGADRAIEPIWADELADRVVEHALDTRAAREAGRETLGLPTGHPGVDRVLNGLQGSSLYVLGGAPGIGKTTLALQWSCHVAAEAGVPTLYVTFENTPRNLALKAICRMARVGSTAVERGREEPTRLRDAARAFAAFGPRLGFLQGSTLTSVDEIEAHARAAMARVGADRCLVVVDYLQRLAYRERFQDVRANVSALSFSLREMAVRLGSPVLALTSLSREVADMDLPTLEALKESGNLEYDADGVLLLGARKEITLGSMARVKAIAGARLLDLLVAKNRYGEADCRIPFLFNAVVGNFEEELPT